MKRLFLSTAVLALLAGTAIAQNAAPPPAPNAPPAHATAMDPPLPGGPGAVTPPPGGPGAPGMAGEDDGGPPPPPGGGRNGHRPPPPPPPRGAHIHLQHGDMLVDVQCNPDEPIKACSDVVLGMLERMSPKP